MQARPSRCGSNISVLESKRGLSSRFCPNSHGVFIAKERVQGIRSSISDSHSEKTFEKRSSPHGSISKLRTSDLTVLFLTKNHPISLMPVCFRHHIIWLSEGAHFSLFVARIIRGHQPMIGIAANIRWIAVGVVLCLRSSCPWPCHIDACGLQWAPMSTGRKIRISRPIDAHSDDLDKLVMAS